MANFVLFYLINHNANLLHTVKVDAAIDSLFNDTKIMSKFQLSFLAAKPPSSHTPLGISEKNFGHVQVQMSFEAAF